MMSRIFQVARKEGRFIGGCYLYADVLFFFIIVADAAGNITAHELIKNAWKQMLPDMVDPPTNY